MKIRKSTLAKSLIDATFPASYLTLLEHVFLVVRVPAWHTNVGKRLVKSPKLHLVDAGVAAHSLGATRERLERDPTLLCALLESFVAIELVKQCSWSERAPRLHHYRTSKGDSVVPFGERLAAWPIEALWAA